jgi:hypothetical protein
MSTPSVNLVSSSSKMLDGTGKHTGEKQVSLNHSVSAAKKQELFQELGMGCSTIAAGEPAQASADCSVSMVEAGMQSS